MLFKNQEGLYEDSIKLLKECGIEFNNGNKQLKAVAYNFPVEVYFLGMMIFRNMCMMVLLILVLLGKMFAGKK